MTDRYENIRDALAGVAERESLRQRAAAWDAVADTLGEVCPEWINHPGTGTESAVAAIRKLAQQPEAQAGGEVAPMAWGFYDRRGHLRIQKSSTKLYANRTMFPLYTTPPAKVPEGWKLVPVEPTDHMGKIGGIWARNSSGHYVTERDVCKAMNIYRAMLAAAPAPKEGV